MFGHEKGAFTGATARRRGRFELADGGTLFLDEVADLGAEAQAKLLRVLEAGVVERVGGQRPVEVDVRVLAATNRDLRSEVAEGRFREDLLFRLDVVPLVMPPLRDRPGDLPLLVEHARHRLRRRHGLPPVRLSSEAMEAMDEYSWPGNVRELLNVVERLTILHSGEEVGGGAVSSILSGQLAPRAAVFDPDDRRDLRERLETYERAQIEGALAQTGGNVAEAGRRLRTDRANLYRRMRRLGLRDDEP
jgi:two-component system nitrogen regulation response regulator NtrX